MGLLALATALGKGIGALYKVPLIGILGAEGMGVYQSVFPLYAALLTMVSGGISTTTARLVALNADNPGAVGLVRRGAMSLAGVLGAVATVGVIALSVPISVLQGGVVAPSVYFALAPAVIPSSLIAVMRGYFQGKGNLVPGAVSQVVEQGAKVVFGLVFAGLLAPRGMLWAVAGAMAGICLASLVALLWLIIAKSQEKPKEVRAHGDIKSGEFAHAFFWVLRLSIPLAVGALTHPLAHLIDSVVVVRILTATIGAGRAIEGFGLYSGAVCALISLPSVATVGITAGIIPSVCRRGAGHTQKLNFALRMALVPCVLMAVIYFAFSREIIGVLYPGLSAGNSALTAQLLQVGSLGVVFSGAGQVVVAFLQGVGAGGRAVRNAFWTLLVRAVLGALLAAWLGIVGVAVSGVVSSALSCVLNVLCWQKYAGRGKILKNVSGICLGGAIILASGMFVSAVGGPLAIPCAVVLGVIYLLLVIRSGSFSAEECKKFPLPGVMSALAGKKGLAKSDNRSRTWKE